MLTFCIYLVFCVHFCSNSIISSIFIWFFACVNNITEIFFKYVCGLKSFWDEPPGRLQCTSLNDNDKSTEMYNHRNTYKRLLWVITLLCIVVYVIIKLDARKWFSIIQSAPPCCLSWFIGCSFSACNNTSNRSASSLWDGSVDDSICICCKNGCCSIVLEWRMASMLQVYYDDVSCISFW